MKYLLVFISLLVFGTACSKEEAGWDELDEIRLLTTIEYKTLPKVDPDLLSMDIYHTNHREANRPVVMWVHGGAWSIGDKAHKIQNKVDLIQSNDWIFVSANYRLSPFPAQISNPDRIMYPDHNNDLADAIEWIYHNIRNYGGNPHKIALLGHSAGAHLVSLLGTRRVFMEERDVPFSIIKGVASIDTQGYDVCKKIEEDIELYVNAFGDNEMLNKEASPLHNIESGKEYPIFFIAKRGLRTRIAVADDFVVALEEAGVAVDQVNGNPYTHSEINEAIGKPGETLMTEPLIEFFNVCFN